MGSIAETSPPKIKFYTNHGCPYAHRTAITLEELKLPYEEILIDLNTPRPQWYLDINPRGLVPSIKYGDNEEIITESAIASQFLMDSFPSHLLPASDKEPLKRARINFFVDTWSTKVGGTWFGIMMTEDDKEKEEKVDKWVAEVNKEIEPLLQGANLFFGGSKDFTLAEVIAAPFIARMYLIAEDGELLPNSVVEKLDSLPNFRKWAKAVREHPSTLKVFPRDEILKNTKTRMAKMRENKK